MVSRLRVDDLAAKELNDLVDEVDGSRKGLASEALRKGVEEIRQEHGVKEENHNE